MQELFLSTKTHKYTLNITIKYYYPILRLTIKNPNDFSGLQVLLFGFPLTKVPFIVAKVSYIDEVNGCSAHRNFQISLLISLLENNSNNKVHFILLVINCS